MKIIDIPAAVVITVPTKSGNQIELKQVEKTFTNFLVDACESYQEFAKGPRQARQYDKIMRVIEACNGNKTIQFEDADFDVLKDVVDRAPWLTPNINRSFMPYYEALEKAQSVAIPGKGT